jgi:hypothetical protein
VGVDRGVVGAGVGIGARGGGVWEFESGVCEFKGLGVEELGVGRSDGGARSGVSVGFGSGKISGSVIATTCRLQVGDTAD